MPSGVPYRILAIDDLPSTVLSLQEILPPGEFDLHGASDVEEALQLLASQPFDLVLLDVVLRGIDGYAVARRVKADPKTASMPVIFLSSLSEADEVVKGFEAGGVDFVSKPFHRTELLLRLRTHLALKDRHEALEKAAQELRQANQARNRFFSILAHDLKNPFSGFLSLIHEILRSWTTLEPAELVDALQTMRQTAQNVHRLLETLLDWGRAQTGDLVLDRQVYSLGLLIEEALEPLEEAFHRKSIGLDQETCLLRVWADRATVVTIIRNLLSNALKFTRPGGKVTLRTQEEGEWVELAVADTGVGIAPNRLSGLFQIESKASTLGTAREPGTGLGLILCSEFAAKNHGSLRVESRKGEGSTFFLSLPRVGA